MIKRVFKNDYILNLLNKIVTICLGVISSALITRYMGASMKGEFSYIVSVSSILSIILNLGIYQAYPNQIRKGLENAKSKFINIFALQFILCSAIGIIVAVTCQNIEVAMISLVTPFSMLVSQVTMICMVEFPIFRSLMLMFVAFVNVVISFFVFTFASQNLLFPVGTLLLKDLIFIIAVLVKSKVIPCPFKVDYKLTISVAKFGILPMLTSLLLTLNYKMDIIMIRQFETTALLGIFAVGVTLADYIWFIPDAFKEVLFSRAAKGDSLNAFNLSLKISIILTTFISICVLIFGKLVIHILYGIEFSESYYMTIILLIGIPFMSMFKIISPLFVAQGNTKFYFFSLLISIIINFLLNLFLIPLWSITGAAVATIVSQIVCGITALIMYLKSNGVKLKEALVLEKSEFLMITSMIRKK